MRFFDDIKNIIDKHEKEQEDIILESRDLEPWQKEEVQEGNYDVDNFEMDDVSDEDDYYHEDDD